MKERDFYIHIDGHRVKVTEEVYREYTKAETKERYFMERLKKGKAVKDAEGKPGVFIPSREISYDQLLERNWNVPSSGETVEDAVIRKDLLEKLGTALHSLTDEELELVRKLFYLEKTEREVSAAHHVSQVAIHKRKKKILKKLRNFF